MRKLSSPARHRMHGRLHPGWASGSSGSCPRRYQSPQSHARRCRHSSHLRHARESVLQCAQPHDAQIQPARPQSAPPASRSAPHSPPAPHQDPRGRRLPPAPGGRRARQYRAIQRPPPRADATTAATARSSPLWRQWCEYGSPARAGFRCVPPPATGMPAPAVRSRVARGSATFLGAPQTAPAAVRAGVQTGARAAVRGAGWHSARRCCAAWVPL